MRRALALAGLAALCAQLFAAFLPSAAFFPLAAVFTCAGVLARVFLCRWRWRSHAALVCLTAAAMLCLRAGYFALVLRPAQGYAGCVHTVTATVEESSPGYTDATVYATARVTQVDGRRVRPLRVKLAQIPQTAPGSAFRAQVRFTALPRNRYQSWYYAKGVYVGAALTEEAAFTPLGAGRGWRDGFLRLRSRLAGSLHALLPGEQGSVAAAMTVGDKAGLSAGLKEWFRRAGLSHILVVSGLHLSAVGGLAYWALNRLRGRAAGAAGGILVTLGFMALVGFTPSVVRAGFVMLAVYIGMLLGRRSDTLTSMGFAALCLCAANPFAAVDVGLLLSFAATLGVLGANAAARALQARAQWTQGAAGRRLGKLLRAVLVPLGAGLGTLPVLIAAGGGISLLGVFSNLLAVPLMAPAVFLGFAAAFAGLSPWLEALARPAGLLCGLCVRGIIAVARWMGALPGYVYLSGAYAVGVCLLFYGLVYLAVRLRVRPVRAAAVCVLFLAVSVGVFAWADRDVLYLYPAGSAENAPLVLLRGGRAAVLFRGPDQSVDDVRRVLEEHGSPAPDLLLDLRADGDTACLAQRLPAGNVVSAKDYLVQARFSLGRGCTVTLRRQAAGTLACVELDGYKVGVSTGKLDLTGCPAFDVYFGGSGAVEGLRAQALVLSRAGRAWTQGLDMEQFPGGVYRVAVRAGGGVKISEESYDFT